MRNSKIIFMPTKSFTLVDPGQDNPDLQFQRQLHGWAVDCLSGKPAGSAVENLKDFSTECDKTLPQLYTRTQRDIGNSAEVNRTLMDLYCRDPEVGPISAIMENRVSDNLNIDAISDNNIGVQAMKQIRDSLCTIHQREFSAALRGDAVDANNDVFYSLAELEGFQVVAVLSQVLKLNNNEPLDNAATYRPMIDFIRGNLELEGLSYDCLQTSAARADLVNQTTLTRFEERYTRTEQNLAQAMAGFQHMQDLLGQTTEAFVEASVERDDAIREVAQKEDELTQSQDELTVVNREKATAQRHACRFREQAENSDAKVDKLEGEKKVLNATIQTLRKDCAAYKAKAATIPGLIDAHVETQKKLSRAQGVEDGRNMTDKKQADKKVAKNAHRVTMVSLFAAGGGLTHYLLGSGGSSAETAVQSDPQTGLIAAVASVASNIAPAAAAFLGYINKKS